MQRILVIDDDPSVTSFLQRGLKLAGFDAKAAGEGAEGLTLLESYCPDLLILDRVMVGMSGLEVLGAVYTLQPNLPVIMLTGRDAIKDENLRVSAYLVKPVAFDVLVDTVKSLLPASESRPKRGKNSAGANGRSEAES